jgi:hypothetical protein
VNQSVIINMVAVTLGRMPAVSSHLEAESLSISRETSTMSGPSRERRN